MDSRDDALEPHAHIPVPGGRVRAVQWEVLADIADELGAGDIQLTSRADLQIPGVRDQMALSSRLDTHGFATSVRHSILCSPLSPDLHELVDALGAALSASETMAGLEAHTLFAIDAGDGAIIAAGPEFGVIRADSVADTSTMGAFQLVLAGVPTGVVVERPAVVPALLAVTAQWELHRGGSLRVAEAPDMVPMLVSHMRDSGLISGQCVASVPEVAINPAPIGWIQDGDAVTLGAGLQFGRLDSRLARFLGAVGADITITPWHSLVIHGLSDGVADQVVKVLAPMGLIFDANSPWLHTSA